MPVNQFGALGRMNIRPMPQGTLDELRRHGLDPRNVGSCAEPVPGVQRGCPLWANCPFHLTKLGGFKGVSGPENVAYYLRTYDGVQTQDYMTCHAFVRTMLSRMRTARSQKELGKPHEIIEIVGTAGTTIKRRVDKKIDPNDHTPFARFQIVTEKLEVPKLRRIGEADDTNYDNQLWKEQQAREAQNPEFAVGLPRDIPEPEQFNEDDVLDMAPAETTSGKKK